MSFFIFSSFMNFFLSISILIWAFFVDRYFPGYDFFLFFFFFFGQKDLFSFLCNHCFDLLFGFKMP